jgi:hypothetical protein
MLAPSKKQETAVVIQVEPIKLGNKFYVSVVIDDHETNPHGPFATSDEAEAVVGRLSRVAHALNAEVTMAAPVAK